MNTKISRLLAAAMLVLAVSVTVAKAQQIYEIESSGVELSEVMRQFTEKTGYSFVYSNTSVDVSVKVTVSVRSADINTILDAIFRGTGIMLAFISAAANNNLEAAYSYYKSVCKEKGYTDQVDGLYRSAVVLVKGAEAPEIEFTDADGRIYTLADFKGKALYVDMWASWCGPCCAEIPHLAKLYKDLGPGSGIECISISIDEDRNDWLGKLDEEKPEWKQFIVTEKGQKQVANSYNIRSIPRFLLFDAQGRIVTVDAPRPSTPDVRKLLDELLTD